MGVLILLAKKPDPATRADAEAGEIPYPEYLAVQEATGATLFDYHDVEQSTHPLVRLARRRGDKHALALRGFLNRRRFDHIYCTGEDVAISLAFLMKGVRDLGRVTVVIHNGGTPKRRAVLRAIGAKVWRHAICLSDDQERVLVEECKLDPSTVRRMWLWTDTDFYDPDGATPTQQNYVFSCGQESRDYETLDRAVQGLDVRVRIKATGWAPHAGFKGRTDLDGGQNIEIIDERLSYRQLVDAYAGADFVVVPVQDVTYAAGVTSICEAMSMGKAVIVSASRGVADYVRDGVTGLLVPPGDPAALRAAIETLAADPERCATMGANGQAWVREDMRTRTYAARVAEMLGRSGADVEPPG